jgi:hypothetical protein
MTPRRHPPPDRPSFELAEEPDHFVARNRERGRELTLRMRAGVHAAAGALEVKRRSVRLVPESETEIAHNMRHRPGVVEDCETADEWLAALRQVPGAMAVKDANFVSNLDLKVACFGHEQTPVCQDAADDGRREPRSRALSAFAPNGELSVHDPI